MKSFRARFVALVVAWAAPVMATAAGVTAFELRERARVEAASIRLGDVATLHGSDAAAIESLAAMDLGAAPRFGEDLRLDRTRIAAWLRRAAPELGAVPWRGAEAVHIARAGQDVPAAEVCAAAERALADALRPLVSHVEVAADCGTAPWAVPAGATLLRPRALPEGQWPARRTSVAVELWVDHEFVRAVSVPVRVALIGTARVAREDVRAQRPLDGEAVEVREVDLAGLPSAPFPAQVTIDGMRLRRPLLAGQVLTAAHLEPLPAVTRGQRVRLRTRSGSIALETSAEAMQDGRPGDPVLIRVHAGTRPLVGRVTGPNQVELQP